MITGLENGTNPGLKKTISGREDMKEPASKNPKRSQTLSFGILPGWTISPGKQKTHDDLKRPLTLAGGIFKIFFGPMTSDALREGWTGQVPTMSPAKITAGDVMQRSGPGVPAGPPGGCPPRPPGCNGWIPVGSMEPGFPISSSPASKRGGRRARRWPGVGQSRP